MNSTTTNTEIEYPLYDISDYGWNEFKEKEHNIIFQNPYPGIVPYQKKKFTDRMKQYEFVDCKGVVYKVTDITFEKPRGIRGFFTLASVIQLHFHPAGKTLDLDQFRSLIISRARETNNANLENAAASATAIANILKPAS